MAVAVAVAVAVAEEVVGVVGVAVVAVVVVVGHHRSVTPGTATGAPSGAMTEVMIVIMNAMTTESTDHTGKLIYQEPVWHIRLLIVILKTYYVLDEAFRI